MYHRILGELFEHSKHLMLISIEHKRQCVNLNCTMHALSERERLPVAINANM